MGRNLQTSLLASILGCALALGALGIAPPDAEPEPAVESAPPDLAPSSPSGLAGYEPDRAGHPLRIVAYALHPVGVILDYLIFRPAYWIGSHEPLRTLFGRDD